MPQPQEQDDDNAGPKIEIVDEGIRSSLFWALMTTFRFIADMLVLCFEWVEGCPCHTHLDWRNIPTWLRNRWSTCPLRGLRLAELAAGDFLEMFVQLCHVNVAQLLVSLPADITLEERGICLQEFERGRSQLLFIVTVNVTCYIILSRIAKHEFCLFAFTANHEQDSLTSIDNLC